MQGVALSSICSRVSVSRPFWRTSALEPDAITESSTSEAGSLGEVEAELSFSAVQNLTEKARLFELRFPHVQRLAVSPEQQPLPPSVSLAMGKSVLPSRRPEAWLGEQWDLSREQSLA